MKTVSFSRLVSSSPAVVTAFNSSGSARLWWRAILWLHGKPTSPTIDDTERRLILADGFGFYAQLYRFLAALSWLVGAACWQVGIFGTASHALYWPLASALAGGFLWFASSLGFSGAKNLRQSRTDARLQLCAFMVAVIAFLSALTAALSVAVQLEAQSLPLLNLAALALVWMFGIGSYLIELIYLIEAVPELTFSG